MTADRSQPWRPSLLRLAAVLLGLALVVPALAQDAVPFLPDSQKFGRVEDKGVLRYCIDPRDPEWPLAEEIGEAIAGALLLKPQEFKIADKIVTSDWDPLYRHLLADCAVYFGFKLIPGGYPSWLMVSRPYYEASYVLAVTDPSWRALADIPRDRPIGSAIGTSGDFALIKYLETVPANRRWRRFPMGDNQAALEALAADKVAAALVWGPAAWAAKRADPAYGKVRFISPAPVPTSTLGVGAVMLSSETFLRANIDQAIAALSADGTIGKIIAAHDFPAEPVK